jgi:hypothetical protein
MFCLSGCRTAAPGSVSAPGASTASAPASGGAGAGIWRSLFDGRTTAGWRGFRMPGMPEGWRVVDGALTRVGPARDIITVEQFDDFELELEWNISPGGNSGIMFRVIESAEQTYFSGPEMQVLDNERHRDGRSRLTSAGSNFALHAAPAGNVRPAGEWNHVRLLVRGSHVEHWLNGVKVVEYELWSPEWEALVRASKFGAWPEYGRSRRGHIALQDHGDRVAYRNIRIRTLP